MAPFFSINMAWGKFQERDASCSLVLSRKASLRIVCSAQHHLITIFKQQIRVGEGEGSSVTSSPPLQTKLRLSGQGELACRLITDWRLKVQQFRHYIARINLPFSFLNCATSVDGECWL